MLCRALKRYSSAFAMLICMHGSASAVILDWDTVSWVDGTLSNSYQADLADPNSGVTITVTPNAGAPLVPFSGAPNPMTPTVHNGFQGGLATIENTLTLAVDLSSFVQSITVTVSFAASGGVSGVSFAIFDIDGGGPYQDQLTAIQALSIDGSTPIAPTITTSANNTLIGSGLSQSVVGTAVSQDTGANSGRGNVLINFGTNQIQSFTFTYGGTAAFADPAYQHFGVHDISFTPVPEVNPAVISVFSCVAAAALVLRHRRNVRK